MESSLSLLYSYRGILLDGALVTIELSLLSLLLSLVIGIVVCMARLSGFRFLRWPAVFYTTVVRGIPDLVQLFLLYFGGQYLLNYIAYQMGWGSIDLEPFASGVLIIGFIFGAYMAETFRGAILAIPRGQIEAAVAYGLNKKTIFWRITWPQMMRYALPMLGNNWLVLMKSTALVSVINLHDLTGIAKTAANSTHQSFLFYSACAVGFLLFTTVSIWVLDILKRKYSLGFHERTG